MDIDSQTQTLLKLGGPDMIDNVIAKLSPAQKSSPAFKAIGEQRYLSSLRVGEIAHAEKARAAFGLLDTFLHSNIVMAAAKEGFRLKAATGHLDVAAAIKVMMNLPDTLPINDPKPLVPPAPQPPEPPESFGVVPPTT